uniref:Uncharacterized protein n=1 Tax=Solibacter usitatus (strain Ellin6076) TaxID=234267 RepID=Q020I7_SOLUE
MLSRLRTPEADRTKNPVYCSGNQLYLPIVGIDFREHFRPRAQSAGKPLSPATQAILIAALMRRLWLREWALEGIATEFGYSPMTTSRAVHELTAAHIATLETRGRTGSLRAMDQLPAGQSALARYSMISEPAWPTYAVAAHAWRNGAGDFEVLAEPEPGASEWQIWSYPPGLGMREQMTVDPLSLTLSMQDSTDERIQTLRANITETLLASLITEQDGKEIQHEEHEDILFGPGRREQR